MKRLSQNLKLIALLFLSSSLIFLYPASILTMNHSAMAMGFDSPHLPITGQSLLPHAPSDSTDACVNFHLNILQNLSQSTPQLPSLILLGLITFAVISISAVAKKKLGYLQTLLLLRHQRLKPISLYAFMTEIGDWLNIIQKKSPAYAFATA